MNFNKFLLILALAPLVDAITLEERFNKLEAKVSAIATENAELKQENAELKKTVGYLRETVDLIQKRLDPSQRAATKHSQDDPKESKVEVRLNDTADLEARVAVLEGDVVEIKDDLGDLEGDVQNIESINILQDQRINEQDGRINEQDTRINIVEAALLDNDQDIAGLLESTNSLTGQVLGLDQRVVELESNGGGDNSNITELTQRVQTLETLTSQLDDVTELLDQRVQTVEVLTSQLNDVTELLDQRVDVLESGTNETVSGYDETVFLAALGDSSSIGTNVVIFDRSEINPSGYYDNTTGYYTVPRDGVYEFQVQMQAFSASASFEIFLQVDNQDTHFDNWSNYPYRSFSVILELHAGQTVHVFRYNGASGDPDLLKSYFWGRMISAI